MKKRGLFGLLLVWGLVWGQDNHEVLFLGNSYTYVNDLPQILRQLTIAGGDTLTYDQNTPGGFTLQGHSTDPTSLAMINARNWDFVILQEQSQRPSFPQSQVATQVYPYATQLNNLIKANDSCTETIFFMTWGRKNGDAGNCGSWPPVCTYAGMQYELRRSYLNMANQNLATVAPVGIAWWEAMLRDTLIELYSVDESHPAYTGSYLSGCVFYATLYRRSPVGLGFYGSLDTATAVFLQQVAHDVVFDSIPQWRIGANDAVAGFTYLDQGNGAIDFFSSSVNASMLVWDFGDGGSGTGGNPSHVYSQSGQYVVQLIADNGCMQDTVWDAVNVVITTSLVAWKNELRVFPNPSSGQLSLSWATHGAGAADISVLDLTGKPILGFLCYSGAKGATTTIDLSDLPNGIYVLCVDISGAQLRKLVSILH